MKASMAPPSRGLASLVLLIAILLGIAAIGGGAYYLADPLNKKAGQLPSAIPTSPGETSKSITAQNVYNDQEHGFSVAVPPGWKISRDSSDQTLYDVISGSGGKFDFQVKAFEGSEKGGPGGTVVYSDISSLKTSYDSSAAYSAAVRTINGNNAVVVSVTAAYQDIYSNSLPYNPLFAIIIQRKDKSFVHFNCRGTDSTASACEETALSFKDL